MIHLVQDYLSFKFHGPFKVLIQSPWFIQVHSPFKVHDLRGIQTWFWREKFQFENKAFCIKSKELFFIQEFSFHLYCTIYKYPYKELQKNVDFDL